VFNHIKTDMIKELNDIIGS